MSSITDQDPKPNPSASIAEVVQGLAAGRIPSGRVAELSDPTLAQAKEFANLWPTLPVVSRRELLREMISQSGKNLALDFTRYFRRMLSDPDDDVRALAVRALWEDSTLSFLVQATDMALEEESPAVQESVAIGLGTFGFQVELDELDPEHAARTQRALFHLIENGANWMVRRRALESAAYMSCNQTVQKMIQQAYESDFEQECAGALVAMGRNLDPLWFPIVLRELTNEDPDIRCEAARAAGEFDDPAAIDPLSRMIDDEDEEVREAAVISIGRIGGRKAIDTLRFLETQVSDELKEAISPAIDEAQFQAETTGLKRQR